MKTTEDLKLFLGLMLADQKATIWKAERNCSNAVMQYVWVITYFLKKTVCFVA